MKAIQLSEYGDELESFDDPEDLFKNWEDSTTKDKELDSSIKNLFLDKKTKEKILSRFLDKSLGKDSRETNAARNQDFLYGEDGMPNRVLIKLDYDSRFYKSQIR